MVGRRKRNNATKGNSRDSLDTSRNWFTQQQMDFKINSKQGVLYTMALPLIEYQQLIFMINWS
jgi:hypothetical protein